MRLSWISILFVSHVFSMTCPTIDNIQSNQLNGWRAYDNRGNLIADIQPFINSFKYFEVAKWFINSEMATCYYLNNSIFLARNHTFPINDLTVWNYTNENTLECVKSIEDCLFVPE